MSNIHDRWDGAPRMNSKERFAKSHARGYGGSAFRDDDGWYASIEALNSIELELQRNQRNISRSATLTNPFANRGSSPWRVSSRDRYYDFFRRNASSEPFKTAVGSNKGINRRVQNPVVKRGTTLRDLYNAAGVMVSSIGAALDLTDFLGHVSTRSGLKVILPKFMAGMGIAAGLFGIYDNGKQLEKQGFNWNDMAQMGVQGVLVGMAVFTVTTGGTIFVPIIAIGGITLFAWELAESHFGW